MTGLRDDTGLSHHPAPQRGAAGGWALGFATIGGPIAWFVQLCASYALFAAPCFARADRLAELPGPARWVWPAAFGLYAACLIVALAAAMVALGLFGRTRHEHADHRGDFEESGNGRTRFLAYWGMLLGFGASVVIFVNLLALLVVPPCA